VARGGEEKSKGEKDEEEEEGHWEGEKVGFRVGRK